MTNPEETPQIKHSRFILSAPTLAHCPPPDRPEFCLAGRSNVGKSSLVNALTNRKKLAKTSNVPGKTREMNYFMMDESWYLVDLPGYGYAKVSKTEQQRWGKAMEEYLLNRKTLNLVILIIDIRHGPQSSDLDMMYWLATNETPFALCLNKSDKLTQTKIEYARQQLDVFQKEMNIEVPVAVVSATTGKGTTELVGLIQDFI